MTNHIISYLVLYLPLMVISAKIQSYKGLLTQFARVFREDDIEARLKLDPSSKRKFTRLGLDSEILEKLFLKSDSTGDLSFGFGSDQELKIDIGNRAEYLGHDKKLLRSERERLLELINNSVEARKLILNPDEFFRQVEISNNRLNRLIDLLRTRASDTENFDAVDPALIMLERSEISGSNPEKFSRLLKASLLLINSRSKKHQKLRQAAELMLNNFFTALDKAASRLLMSGSRANLSLRQEHYINNNLITLSKFLIPIFQALPKKLSAKNFSRLESILKPFSNFPQVVNVLSLINRQAYLDKPRQELVKSDLIEMNTKQAAEKVLSFIQRQEGSPRLALRIRVPAYDYIAGSIAARENSFYNSFATGKIHQSQLLKKQGFTVDIQIERRRSGLQEEFLISNLESDTLPKNTIKTRLLFSKPINSDRHPDLRQKFIEHKIRSFIRAYEFSSHSTQVNEIILSSHKGFKDRLSALIIDIERNFQQYHQDPSRIKFKRFFPSIYRNFKDTGTDELKFTALDVDRISKLISTSANSIGPSSSATKKEAKALLNNLLRLFVFNLRLIDSFDPDSRIQLGRRSISAAENFIENTIESSAAFNSAIYSRLKHTPGAGSNIFRSYAYMMQQAIKQRRTLLEAKIKDLSLIEKMKKLEEIFEKRFNLARITQERKAHLNSVLELIWRGSELEQVLNAYQTGSLSETEYEEPHFLALS